MSMPHVHHGCCAGGSMGDPALPPRLLEAAERIGAAAGAGEEAASRRHAAAARPDAELALDDSNPRTRAQARALLLALDLIERGDLSSAGELLNSTLPRSFPGNADFEKLPETSPMSATRRRLRS